LGFLLGFEGRDPKEWTKSMSLEVRLLLEEYPLMLVCIVCTLLYLVRFVCVFFFLNSESGVNLDDIIEQDGNTNTLEPTANSLLLESDILFDSNGIESINSITETHINQKYIKYIPFVL
jgi:hypothetical protein